MHWMLVKGQDAPLRCLRFAGDQWVLGAQKGMPNACRGRRVKDDDAKVKYRLGLKSEQELAR